MQLGDFFDVVLVSQVSCSVGVLDIVCSGVIFIRQFVPFS